MSADAHNLAMGEAQIVDITTVHPYPNNPRRGDIGRLRDSLRAHGQYLPLLVQASTNYVIKGNNTLAAMLALGWTKAVIRYVELDDAQASAILLMDNKSSDSADYDLAALSAMLGARADDDWGPTGWHPDEMDDLLAVLTMDQHDVEQLVDAPEDTPVAHTAGRPMRAVEPLTLVVSFDSADEQAAVVADIATLREHMSEAGASTAAVLAHALHLALADTVDG